MAKRIVVVTVLIAVYFLGPASAGHRKPDHSKIPLGGEQVAVYSAFLKSYDNGAGGIVNLADRTRAMEISDEELSGCLKGLGLEKSAEADAVIQKLLPENIDPKQYRLVDAKKYEIGDSQRLFQEGKSVESAVGEGFATGLLTLSEVVFDKEHIRAAMSFSFVCGSLCGHGGTLVFEKVGNEWQEVKISCGGWIS